MPNPGFSFKFLTPARDEGGRSTSRPSARRQVNVETLEGRSLLSGVHASSLASTKIAQADHLQQRPHAGPVLNEIGVGFAVKSPRFYEVYNGPLNSVFNAAGMKATYDAKGDLILTGIIVGNVNNAPQTDAASEYYVFGINHNVATTVAPFPGRPNIKYDAIVAVGFTPAGVAGYVLDTTTGVLTPLSQDNILNQNSSPIGSLSSDIKVFVPAGTPGIQQNADGSNPTAIFWAQVTAPSLNPNPQDIASFAPDGRNVLIAGAPGRQPPPHLV